MTNPFKRETHTRRPDAGRETTPGVDQDTIDQLAAALGQESHTDSATGDASQADEAYYEEIPWGREDTVYGAYAYDDGAEARDRRGAFLRGVATPVTAVVALLLVGGAGAAMFLRPFDAPPEPAQTSAGEPDSRTDVEVVTGGLSGDAITATEETSNPPSETRVASAAAEPRTQRDEPQGVESEERQTAAEDDQEAVDVETSQATGSGRDAPHADVVDEPGTGLGAGMGFAPAAPTPHVPEPFETQGETQTRTAALDPAADEPRPDEPGARAEVASPDEPGTTDEGGASRRSAQATVVVNMRAEPDNDAEVLHVVPANASLDVLSCDGWCEVVYEGERGYVYGKFVTGSGLTADPNEVSQTSSETPAAAPAEESNTSATDAAQTGEATLGGQIY